MVARLSSVLARRIPIHSNHSIPDLSWLRQDKQTESNPEPSKCSRSVSDERRSLGSCDLLLPFSELWTRRTPVP